MTVPPVDPNKILDDATVALEGLCRAMASVSSEEDYTPKETSRKAYEALLRVQQAVKENPEVLSAFSRSGRFKEVVGAFVEKMGSSRYSPAVQTALGTLAVELLGVFNKVQAPFYEKDARRISRKDSDPLGKN